MEITHSFVVQADSDPLRKIQVSRTAKETTLVAILTFNDGPDQEPFVTKMHLTKAALGLLSSALHTACHDMDQYLVKKEDE